MAVYSKRFFIAIVRSSGEADDADYFVPQGYTAILRSLTWWCYAPGSVLFGKISPGLFQTIASSQGLAAQESRHVEMHLVMNELEHWGCLWQGGADVTLSCSGYLLRNASPE